MGAKNIQAEQLKELIQEKKIVLVDFWAPWCPDCIRIHSVYEELARQHGEWIEVVKVNVDRDADVRREWNVVRIPTIRLYVEGREVGSIVEPESKAEIDGFLSGILPERKEAEEHVYDMLIVGGGPGGYTAALYGARAGLETLVLEKLSAGGQMALTHQIDNYPGFADGVEGYELGQQMEKQARRFGAKTKIAQVRSVNLQADPKAVYTSEGTFYGRTVVLATGANPRELGVAQEKELVGRGVAYCAACDGMFYRGKTVVVVGGGNSAAADALLLSRIAKKVIIVHRRDTLRATKIYHEPLMQAENVEFMWNSVVTEWLYEDMITGVRIRNVHTGEETELAAEGVFVSVGRKPATEMFREQLALDENGYIVAGEDTKTTVPGVYAVGDVRTKALRQVVTAVADGAVAVHMAEEYLAGKG